MFLDYKQCLLLLAAVWAGIVLGISFLEAWVKFRAKTLTRPVGLDVGRTVFKALNRVELCLSFAAFVLLLLANCPEMILPIAIVLIQTFSLQPVLFKRAQDIIDGKHVASRPILHIVYVGSEFVKVAGLLYVSVGLLIPGNVY
eukprot:TRINITY_DN866_c0_g1_i1.p1 TRINITY_DN866_c0_g1~~TRINITY_DN866_c0_g1_i1.p1  ORF type:complete len:143 (-),score=10.07 TRINITY_DN866_c0_g1_i1:743-1171(-)